MDKIGSCCHFDQNSAGNPFNRTFPCPAKLEKVGNELYDIHRPRVESPVSKFGPSRGENVCKLTNFGWREFAVSRDFVPFSVDIWPDVTSAVYSPLIALERGG